jgi:tetratricopeptide (TPR) repeat protein
MAGNIFINYRREESSHVAGRLHDSLAPTFGGNKLFMDVDNIPVGRDFEDYLKSQVAGCDAMLAIIGPNWLTAKDETGQRRLDNPNDFVAIEIGAALARKIPVVPVLVDGARMPRASELPDSLKPLARRQAIEVRHTNFSSDAEALVKRLREALGYDSPQRRRRMQATIGVAAIAVLFVLGLTGYKFFHYGKADIEDSFRHFRQAEQLRAGLRAEEEVKRKAGEAEQQRLAAVKAEQERQAAAEAEAKRKADADRKRKEGEEAGRAGDYGRAMANLNEAIRLNPNVAVAYYDRALTYSNIGDPDRAIADYNEAIRLNPRYASAFSNRGLVYERKGDLDRAVADYNEAIRIDPMHARAFNNRGVVYMRKGDYNRAILDYNEALRLDPQFALALCNRGMLKRKINDSSGNADVAEAKQLDASVCR